MTVEIRNNATGEIRDCSDQFKDWPDMETTLYSWGEGNFSCDCNRSDFFGFDEDHPCGHSCFSARLTSPDCAKVYSDFAEDNPN